MMESVGILVALSAGLLSFLSPCVLPLVPSFLTFITGMTLEEIQEGNQRRAVMTHALLFVGGFTLVFLLLGASASFLGQFFRHYEEWVARVGGVVIIIFGLHLTGLLRLTPLLRERRLHVSGNPAGYMGTVGVGAAFGAGWTPCIGPVLGAILTFAAAQETFWQGVGLLGVYSAGLAIPFLLASVALDRFLTGFGRFRRYLSAVEVASGVLLLVLGILLMTGSFTALTSWLVPLTPEFLLERI